MMTKKDLEPIIETYYKALEEGNILGRKCKKCGHIEFPPYLCCNTCGCLDTEWVNLNDMRGVVKQVLPTVGAFGDPDFRKQQGDYWAIEVVVPNQDPINTSLVHIDADKLDEFTEKVWSEDVYVRPVLIQDEDVKVVVWELEGDSEFKKMPEAAAQTMTATEKTTESVSENIDISNDKIAQTVIECAAEAYGVDASEITLATDIREDLSNESMKMIVMISQIEDELDATIEIQEASLLNTIADFVNKVKEQKGAGDEDISNDKIAQTVIECAAEAYGVDASELTLATDIREDLSNESMKMIVMISQIEDELDATIEIQEASLLNTLGDFVNKVKEMM